MTFSATSTTPPATQPTPPATQPTPPTTLPRTVGRWAISFIGFPIGGVAAMVAVGPVDTPWRAVIGGLTTGAVLGAVQGWGMRADRRLLLAWVFATALGLAAGLTVATSLVGFGTDLDDLVTQGAVGGFAVGAAQTVALFRRTGPIALLWPAWLAAAWALGWLVTTAIGVQVHEQFSVFGSAGAITATLLTAVLPVVLHARARQETRS